MAEAEHYCSLGAEGDGLPTEAPVCQAADNPELVAQPKEPDKLAPEEPRNKPVAAPLELQSHDADGNTQALDQQPVYRSDFRLIPCTAHRQYRNDAVLPVRRPDRSQNRQPFPSTILPQLQ